MLFSLQVHFSLPAGNAVLKKYLLHSLTQCVSDERPNSYWGAILNVFIVRCKSGSVSNHCFSDPETVRRPLFGFLGDVWHMRCLC